MKPCCLASAKRYLRKNRDVASCDQCRFLLMAYTQQRDYDEARKTLKAWGGEFYTVSLGNLQVIAKARSSSKRM
jgi:hypothetical protein